MKWSLIIVFFFSCTATKTIGRLQGRVVKGNVVRFQWRSLNDVKLDAPNGYFTTFKVDKVGTYQFELTGFDSSGNYGKDTIQIQVIK